jgi:hypothetical protein
VELLTATTLTLIMMAAVATVFGMIGESVSAARSTLEMTDALRGAAARLKADLEGVTATMMPPRRPEDGEGYFEYTEGPIGPVVTPQTVARNIDNDPDTPDTTVGDIDDVLMFTTRAHKDISGRSHGDLFVGRRYNSVTGTIDSLESQDAEVAWFVRGRTLYRRVLLVRPDAGVNGTAAAGFFANYDISVRAYWDTSVSPPRWSVIANSLADLTKPENRFAHQNPSGTYPGTYPYHPTAVTGWATSDTSPYLVPGLGLPLLQECSDPSWVAGGALPTVSLNPSPSPPFDAWLNPHPWQLSSSGNPPAVDNATGGIGTGVLLNSSGVPMGTRFGEDVILHNVIGFDVKAWDPNAALIAAVDGSGNVSVLSPGDAYYLNCLNACPAPPATASVTLNGNTYTVSITGYGAYVDLGYASSYTPPSGVPQPLFNRNNYDATGSNPGPRSNLARVYDTWSLHYEYNGTPEVGNIAGLPTDAGTNGFDDNGDGVVDDILEKETQAPYPVPLRGIQIKIRVFEPDSRQIREVTIVQDFLGK